MLDGAITANQWDITAYFFDVTPQATTTERRGGVQRSVSNNTTDVDIVDAPAVQGRIRNVHTVFFHNRDTATSIIYVKTDDNGTESRHVKLSVRAGETLVYEDGAGFHVLTPISINVTSPGAADLTFITSGTTSITLPLTGTMMTLAGSETGSNKTFDNSNTYNVKDSLFTLQDDGGATRLGQFQLSGVTAGQTRILTWPDFNGTIATLAGTETLTGKTINLTSNTLTGTIAQFNTALSDQDFATLAGTEELDNKTLDASVAKGVWTASGTWTLPALTLGGVVSGGGQQVNNVIIGTVTPLAGFFTTLNATGSTTLGDNVADLHTITGEVRITETSGAAALQLIGASSGDRAQFVPQTTGGGLQIAVYNAALTDYEPLRLYGETIDFEARTGVLTNALIARVTSAGLIFPTDNTYDIGASGATRPRDFFLGRNALIGGTLGVTGTTTLGTLAATTINAFTLAGTIAGGGNQLNNIIIGTATPLAGFFTSVVLTGTLTGPATMLAPITNSLGADVALNNTANYFDGPSIAQGTVGTWFVSGTVSVTDSGAGPTAFIAKLWDGTTVIASARTVGSAANISQSISLSGFITTPAGNLRISVKDPTANTGLIKYDSSGEAKDSTITAIRIA